MNVLEALITLQNSIPEDKSHHQMIRTIMANLHTVKNSTIYETARLCHTSTASVGRLCAHLGFDNYVSFRSALADTLEHYEFYNHLLPVNFENTPWDIHQGIAYIARKHWETIQNCPVEDIEKAADILHHKSNVHFFSHFPTSMVFLSLQENLIMNGKQSYYHAVLKDSEESPPANLTAQSAALFIIPDLHRETPLLNLYRLCRQAGADTIVIFTKPRPYWEDASLKIYLPGSSSLLDAHLSQYCLEMLSCIYRIKYLR